MISEHDLGHSEQMNVTTTDDGDIIPIPEKADDQGYTYYQKHVSTRRSVVQDGQFELNYSGQETADENTEAVEAIDPHAGKSESARAVAELRRNRDATDNIARNRAGSDTPELSAERQKAADEAREAVTKVFRDAEAAKRLNRAKGL